MSGTVAPWDHAADVIGVEQLQELMRSGAPLRLLDVRWRQDRPEGLPEYLRGHIPDALFVDMDYELSATSRPPEEGHHPLPGLEEFTQTAQRWGVEPDQTVVVYDDMKNLSAARAWWLLRHAGFTDVRVLDGSLRAWTGAGLPLQGEMALSEPSEVALQWGRMPTAQVDQILHRDPASALIDARPARRYAGLDDPLSPRPGHIPGAISAPTAENVDAQGRLLPADALRRRYVDLGVDPSQPVYCYCYSGIHSSHTVLALRRAGFHPVLYPGGFGQWSHSEHLEVISETPSPST